MLEFALMGDPLGIPEEKRAGGGFTSFFEAPERGWWFWIIVAGTVVVNLWYDYHHPLWLLLDIFIVILVVRSNAWSQKQ